MMNLQDDLKRSNEDLEQIYGRNWRNMGKFIDLVCSAKFIFYRSIRKFVSWKARVYADMFKQRRVWTIWIFLKSVHMYKQVRYIKSACICGFALRKARMVSELMVAQRWLSFCISVLKSGLSLIFWLQWFHCSVWCNGKRMFVDKWRIVLKLFDPVWKLMKRGLQWIWGLKPLVWN